MDTNHESTINRILEEIKSLARTETVIGEPFSLGEFTCVPVIKIGLGIAAGTGVGNEPKRGSGSGSGTGGGIGISPIAFLVSRGNEISVLSLDKKKGLSGAFDKVPDLLEKMIETRRKDKD